MVDDEMSDSIAGVLATLDRTEKEALAMGRWDDAPSAVPFVYTDGPNGVRGADGATAYPSPLALAATFDTTLARLYGESLAGEVLAAGRNVLLGPVLDVARVPWDGRTGEGLGEDPELVAQMGGAIIEGVQDQGVLAVLKHLVANNAELMRTGSGPFWARSDAVDVVVDEEPLRDVYLLPFERATRDHGAAAIMSSYNRLAGEYPAQDSELWRMVRDEWGFEGITLPDYLFAVRDDERAMRAGLDLPGLGDSHGRTPEMVGRLTDDELDVVVTHILRAARMVSLQRPHEARDLLGGERSLALAQSVAAAGMVLLANDGILPLPAAASVAVVGPRELGHLLLIGGSAAVEIPQDRRTSLAAELRGQGLTVVQIETTATDLPLPSATANDGFTSIEATIIVAGTETSRSIASFQLEDSDVAAPTWRARIVGEFTAPATAAYRITSVFAGDATLLLDGVPAISGFREASPMIAGPQYPLHHVVDLEAGQRLTVVLEYSTGAAITVPGTTIAPHVRLGIRPLEDPEVLLAATPADDPLIVIGGRASGEAMDVESIHLPEDQLRLLGALTQSHRVILVTFGSGPLALPDLPFAAVVHAWQAGEGGPAALAEVLTGMREPRGRLPVSFPFVEADVPLDPEGYPGDGQKVVYTEGVDVGYRGYERRGRRPAFPFGHGLGYADIVVDSLTCHIEGSELVARATVVERSGRSGASVAQLYVATPGMTKALRAFQAFEMDAGDSSCIELRVPLSRLGTWTTGGRAVVAGEYLITVGISSADQSAVCAINLG